MLVLYLDTSKSDFSLSVIDLSWFQESYSWFMLVLRRESHSWDWIFFPIIHMLNIVGVPARCWAPLGVSQLSLQYAAHYEFHISTLHNLAVLWKCTSGRRLAGSILVQQFVFYLVLKKELMLLTFLYSVLKLLNIFAHNIFSYNITSTANITDLKD